MRYGRESILTIYEEEPPLAIEKEKKYIQQVMGSFLYYAGASDLTILQALSAIASEQVKPTKHTLARVH